MSELRHAPDSASRRKGKIAVPSLWIRTTEAEDLSAMRWETNPRVWIGQREGGGGGQRVVSKSAYVALGLGNHATKRFARDDPDAFRQSPGRCVDRYADAGQGIGSSARDAGWDRAGRCGPAPAR